MMRVLLVIEAGIQITSIYREQHNVRGMSWAELVSKSPCPCVCLCVCLSAPSGAVFFEASHWLSGHMISSRPLIGPQIT